jgi:putative PEP-CTERM system TPR-repeat lipoprotein
MKSTHRAFILALPLAIGSVGLAHADPIARAKAYIAKDQPRDAMLVLRNYLRDHQTNGPVNFMLAQLDLQLGNPVSAEREARAARTAGYQPDRALTLLLDSYLAQRRFIDLLHDFPIGTDTGETAARIALARASAERGLDRADRATADLKRAETFDDKLPAVWLARQDAALQRGDAAAAARDLAQARSLAPDDPDVALSEARAELGNHQPDAAVKTLHALLARDPANVAARITLANALIASGQPKPAQAEITKVLAIAPGSVGALYLQAGLYVDQQNWKAAQGVLQRLSPVMSDLPGAYFLQAETLLHLGEFAAAQQDAAHFVARAPHDPAGRRLLAALALKNNHPHLALTTLDAAGPALDQDFGMTMLHAAAEQATGNATAAKSDFARAARLDPKQPTPLIHLGQLDLASGNAPAAMARFQQAAALAPNNPGLQVVLAQAAIASGDQATAKAAIARLDALKGKAAGSLLSAQLHLASFDLAAARNDYATTLKAQPNNVGAMLGIAHIDLLQGDEAGAEAMTARAIKADPTNQAAVSALASLLASTKNFSKTGQVLEAAHKAAPDNPVFIADLASLDIRLKQFAQAKSMLDGVAPGLQNNPLILAARSQVALAQHDVTGAKSDLTALIRNDPQNAGARLALVRLDASNGDTTDAATEIDEALKALPHNIALLQAQVGLAFKDGGATKAMATARRLADDSAHQPQSLTLPGSFDLAQNHPKQAVAAFTEVAASHPSVSISLNLAQAQAIAGDRAGAAATLDAAIKTYGPVPALENAAGQIALADNDLAGAAAHYQAALAKSPNDVLALNNLAWISGKQNKTDAAGLAARAYAISPTPQVADTLGWILARQSKSKQALVLLDQAHQGMPGDPNVAYHYASVLAQTGDKTKAAAILKPALATKAAFPDRAEAEKLDATLSKS